MTYLFTKTTKNEKNFFKCTLIVVGSITLLGACKKNATAKAEIMPTQTSNTESFDFRTDKLFNETFAQKQSNHSKAREEVNMERIQEIYVIEDEETRKTAFSMLNATEKFVYWSNLTELKINMYEFNDSQKKLLLDLRAATVNETMFGDIELQEIFRTQYLPNIAKQLAEAKITGDHMDKIFVSGSGTDIRTPGSAKVKCVCSSSSMFGCSGCKSGGCTETASGCGFYVGSDAMAIVVI